MSNPLLDRGNLPKFTMIKPEHVEPAITDILTVNRARLDALLKENEGQYTVENFLLPFEDGEDQLEQAWSPVSHLNSVLNSDELRDAYNASLPKLSQYGTELGQNKALYNAYKALKDDPKFTSYSTAQQKVIQNALRDFHLSGVDLPEAKQKRYGEIQQRLSELCSKFSENVLDATNAWSKHIKDTEELKGVPENSLHGFEHAAQEKSLEGYRLTLDIPCYIAVMTYCENTALRQEMYEAYNTRASELGPHAGQWDNNPLMQEILGLRHELAQLLGFKSYAERSIATKMTESTEQVMGFLTDLAQKSLPAAKRELEELRSFAQTKFGIDTLNAWDVAFYSEKLKHEKYDISQEALRPWFPLEKVLSGLFEIAGKLFGITLQSSTQVDLWHPDARYYDVLVDGEIVAGFYLDLYARAKKRGGAWMADCKSRRRNQQGELQTPVAFLVCNFNGPVKDKPALLTHSEVTTLFHEFGHGLHHMLTQVEEGPVSGINGVAWDAVELPSQFLENWCWEREAIPLMSGHYETGEPLPDDMLDKMLAAKNFQSAMQMVRQLEFSLFDFRIHSEYQEGMSIHGILDDVRSQVAVMTPPGYNRFETSFSHIFSGGYAAGYYSYKWAEVLSADAFSLFEEKGIFDAEAGLSFKQNILEKGGSEEPMALFIAFRGREPSVDALLRHAGLAA